MIVTISSTWFAQLAVLTPALIPSWVEATVKLLAVIGGAAVGAGGTGLVLRLAGRFVGGKALPARIGWGLRLLGGVAAGWVVWLMVMAPGGSGLFGGGGSFFGGTGGETGTAHGPAPVMPEQPGIPKNDPLQESAMVRVTLLGGARVVGERFYLPEGATAPLTLDELKSRLKEDKKTGRQTIELLIFENSVARNHPAVQELEDWAEQNDFKVQLAPRKGEIP